MFTMMVDKFLHLGLRAMQVFLAILVLSFSAYIDWWTARSPLYGPHAASSIGFLIFVPIVSLISAAYLHLCPRYFPKFAHPKAPFLVLCMNSLFYMAGFIALAVYLSHLNYCNGSVCHIAKADCVMAAFSYVAWILEAAVVGLALAKDCHGAVQLRDEERSRGGFEKSFVLGDRLKEIK